MVSRSGKESVTQLYQYQMAEIATLYRKGYTLREISKKTHHGEATIRAVIRELGIEHAEILVYDSPEEQEMCRNCEREDCGNCIPYLREKRRKEKGGNHECQKKDRK